MNKKRPPISIEDQLAPLGGLWEKKSEPWPWAHFDQVPMVIVSIPNQAKKKSPPRMANCFNCKWRTFDGEERISICQAVGGDNCLYINNSPRCKRLYRAR